MRFAFFLYLCTRQETCASPGGTSAESLLSAFGLLWPCQLKLKSKEKWNKYSVTLSAWVHQS